MTIKASGRSALILATGLFACAVGPSQATAVADNTAASSKSGTAAAAPVAANKYTRHGWHHGKVYAHRRAGKLALKSSADKKTADDSDSQAAIPPAVANANAELMPADAPGSNAKAMSARADGLLQAAADNPVAAQPVAHTQIVSADLLNDVDRALHESQPPAPTAAMASAETPAAPPAPVAASRDESSTWDQTSLIGKIFIAFGGLLTLASAARMFMA